jgi:hypothetical protein
MNLENIATALGILSTIIGAVKWIISKFGDMLKVFIQTENAELSMRITNTQKQLLEVKGQNDHLRKQLDELRTHAAANRIVLGEIAGEMRTDSEERKKIVKTLEKSTAEWLNADYVRIKGGPRE